MVNLPDNRRFRLVALDVDGTVLTTAQQVTPELKKALSRLADLSVRIVLCTGRRWRTTVEVLAELEHVHPVVVCSGGAQIKRADDERTLYLAPMEHAAARLATDLLRRGSLVPLLLYDRPLSERELKVAESDRARAERLPYLLANPGAWEWYRGDYPDTDERPLVVYTMDESRNIRAAEPRLREGLGERATVQVLPPGRYGAGQLALEFHDPGATKWQALHWLLQRWEVRPEEVVAIGDDVNDIPMLEGAGLSFAMGNASDEVKAVADAVTAGNDAHGVVEALASVFER